MISIRWWDAQANRYRWARGVIGEGGLEPGIPYVVDGAGKLVRKVAT